MYTVPNIDFNPLPRKEGDLMTAIAEGTDMYIISIHSLVKRETKMLKDTMKFLRISIHSLVKRETVKNRPLGRLVIISIHSLVKRET